MPSYRIEYHRVWVKTVEAENSTQARQIVEDEMGEEADAEDYNYTVVKKQQAPDRDSGGEGHNSAWGA